MTILKNLSLSHNQNKSFGNGDFWEIAGSKKIEYPLIWVNILPSNFSGNVFEMNFIVIFADKVLNNEGNEGEVLSDRLQVLTDFFSQLHHPNFDNQFQISENITITPFTERFEDSIAGWTANITFQISFQKDRCLLPSNYLFN